MTTIVEGVYKQGKIDLLHPLPNVPEGHVRVIILAASPAPPQPLVFGKYQTGRLSTPADFKDAQWHVE
jgi:hypothetical protein